MVGLVAADRRTIDQAEAEQIKLAESNLKYIKTCLCRLLEAQKQYTNEDFTKFRMHIEDQIRQETSAWSDDNEPSVDVTKSDQKRKCPRNRE